MDIHERRRLNVLRLIDEKYGGVRAKLAAASGMKASFMYSICVEGPHGKNIGEKVARKFEEAAGLPENALDAMPPGHEPPPAVRTTSPQKVGKGAYPHEVTDNSMDPDFIQGEQAIIDPNVKPEGGDFVLARIKNVEVLRRYVIGGVPGRSAFMLGTSNPAYGGISPDDVQVTILGTVVERRQYRSRWLNRSH